MIVGKQEQQQLTVSLDPNWADVSVTTVPDGAEILPGMAGEATIEARLPEGTGRTGITNQQLYSRPLSG